MNALTCVIASDDDVDAASAQTDKKEHVRSDRMSSAADASDAHNIEKKRGVCSQRSENIAAQAARMLARWLAEPSRT